MTVEHLKRFRAFSFLTHNLSTLARVVSSLSIRYDIQKIVNEGFKEIGTLK